MKRGLSIDIKFYMNQLSGNGKNVFNIKYLSRKDKKVNIRSIPQLSHPLSEEEKALAKETRYA